MFSVSGFGGQTMSDQPADAEKAQKVIEFFEKKMKSIMDGLPKHLPAFDLITSAKIVAELNKLKDVEG
jgi:hypothetical protein